MAVASKHPLRARTTRLLVPSPTREFCENNPGLSSSPHESTLSSSPHESTARARAPRRSQPLETRCTGGAPRVDEPTDPVRARPQRKLRARARRILRAKSTLLFTGFWGGRAQVWHWGGVGLGAEEPGHAGGGSGCAGCSGSNMTCTRSTSLGRSRYGAYGLCTLLFNYCIRMLRCSTAKMQIASYLHYC